jgi:hypothetical protein
MSDNTTPPVATSSSGEIPVEILTAANAHLSHGKTFGGSPGAETPPADPFRAARQMERHMATAKPSGSPLDGARLIATIVYDDEAGVMIERPAAPPPSVSQEGGMQDPEAPEPNCSECRGRGKINGHEWLAGGYEQLVCPSCMTHAAIQRRRIKSLQQQLADALLTARYQSDVSRQADDAREKAEHERDAVIATAADTIFTTTQAWVEQLGALQAENAGLRAKVNEQTRMIVQEHHARQMARNGVGGPLCCCVVCENFCASLATPTERE